MLSNFHIGQTGTMSGHRLEAAAATVLAQIRRWSSPSFIIESRHCYHHQKQTLSSSSSKASTFQVRWSRMSMKWTVSGSWSHPSRVWLVMVVCGEGILPTRISNGWVLKESMNFWSIMTRWVTVYHCLSTNDFLVNPTLPQSLCVA